MAKLWLPQLMGVPSSPSSLGTSRVEAQTGPSATPQNQPSLEWCMGLHLWVSRSNWRSKGNSNIDRKPCRASSCILSQVCGQEKARNFAAKHLSYNEQERSRYTKQSATFFPQTSSQVQSSALPGRVAGWTHATVTTPTVGRMPSAAHSCPRESSRSTRHRQRSG